MWLEFTTFRKGFTFDLLATFFLDIFFVTFLGYLSMPATRAWLKGLSVVPSSEGFTITAFLPAYLPESSRTTLPPFMIFPMTTSLAEVNQAIKALYQIHIPLPPKIDPTVTMMQVEEKP